MSSGWSGERPDLVQLPNDSAKVSPHLSSRRSPTLSRRRVSALVSVCTGASGERPLLGFPEEEELTKTTRGPEAVSRGGMVVQPVSSDEGAGGGGAEGAGGRGAGAGCE